jgi:hypothetical protein
MKQFFLCIMLCALASLQSGCVVAALGVAAAGVSTTVSAMDEEVSQSYPYPYWCIVQDGRTLVNCLAYIDLNPVRANIVKRPEDYRWSSLGYHLQTRNRGGFLSLDLGMAEWGVKPGERLQKYREFVYETGALDTGKGARLDPALVKKERSKGYKLTTADRLRCRTRYFTDSGIRTKGTGKLCWLSSAFHATEIPSSRFRIPFHPLAEPGGRHAPHSPASRVRVTDRLPCCLPYCFARTSL